MDIAYDSPSALKNFLESRGLAMSKRLGQNFLVDRNSRRRLFETIGADPGALVWEIGPGIGSITSILLESHLQVVAFELDHGFARVLREAFDAEAGFSLVEGDFLKTWKGALQGGRPQVIFGNLPYSAALAIVADLLEEDWVPPRLVFTVQKEAARRMAASPGTKDYSAFSVLCSSVCLVRIRYDIGASAFWPQPRVTSSVVTLEPRPEPLVAEDRLGFSRFVRAAFSSRRKTLRNNLQAHAAITLSRLEGELARIGAPPDVRAEALAPERLADLYRSLRS